MELVCFVFIEINGLIAKKEMIVYSDGFYIGRGSWCLKEMYELVQ
jgi:hypothetical protein